ncbi:1-acylglycerol-3-phosphate O-acyltransferase ABHD5 isoform X2 [Pararge aegeria]|uniref:1-acylglycerol-3-phosphate O-acyltransferase ABHD5 n=1 Tax=Pararge aegeria aegeria TaxID=348720 RepID=A0A8S4S2P3_9NEOP|nr:1-acylglycerol-3-phosphate O-acyltransferase ABHD5 isoform X2 [Pararge aegeria]CAH2242278.1 jg25201 [Pararge aegeria aegeria]
MGSEINIETASSSVSRTWIWNILAFVWNWTGGWFSWTRQSDAMLRNIEQTILSCVKTAYKRFYVDIGSVVGQCDKIWTISLNDESAKTPLVMLHGMGAGVALWCPNLDAFAATRPVYAIDLLGFGRSSRPKFASDAEKVEAQWVESVEEWRREVKLDEFVLLGHSLGGFIATAYALKYPERVRHLVLADPWGFPEKPNNVYEKYQVPFWVRAVATAVQPLNPLWAVRAAGPAGKWLVSKTRPDISRKYLSYVPDAHTVIPEYIYQCNSQSPSGESAFHTLMHGFGWAKNPMVRRVTQLDPALPITVLYGSRSWVDNSTGQLLKENRPSSKTYVQVINGAGHHVYLDKPEQFNKYVLEACVLADDSPRRVTTDKAHIPKNSNSEVIDQATAS